MSMGIALSRSTVVPFFIGSRMQPNPSEESCTPVRPIVRWVIIPLLLWIVLVSARASAQPPPPPGFCKIGPRVAGLLVIRDGGALGPHVDAAGHLGIHGDARTVAFDHVGRVVLVELHDRAGTDLQGCKPVELLVAAGVHPRYPRCLPDLEL